MRRDVSPFLWLLKLGAVINVFFLVETFRGSGSIDGHIVVPAVVLFSVSAFRCVFPNRYKDNVVFHDTPLSSIFLTRVLATAVEVTWIYQFSRVIRLTNTDEVAWIDALSWLMVIVAAMSQGFVWAAILTGRVVHYLYEETGWAVIFAVNTACSVYLYVTIDSLGAAESVVALNVVFGLVYLPWQMFHLRSLRTDARSAAAETQTRETQVFDGLASAISVRHRRTDSESWGGLVGLTWMAGYWATLIPAWVHVVVQQLGTS